MRMVEREHHINEENRYHLCSIFIVIVCSRCALIMSSGAKCTNDDDDNENEITNISIRPDSRRVLRQ
jgi:hypothetical protein